MCAVRFCSFEWICSVIAQCDFCYWISKWGFDSRVWLKNTIKLAVNAFFWFFILWNGFGVGSDLESTADDLLIVNGTGCREN